MYCPACPGSCLLQFSDNTRVVDFVCPSCGAEFQLKAKSGRIGKKLRDAAYRPMMERISASHSPHFAFLQYDSRAWRVENLLLVPGHFITPGAIERCKPLSPGARRAGWVGCNILTDAIPADGRITVVSAAKPAAPANVRRQWEQFAWLSGGSADLRGWTSDVLRCVRDIGAGEFSLQDVYEFEHELNRLHPANRNVRAKIRQQLQILRDRGVLQFLGRGKYIAC